MGAVVEFRLLGPLEILVNGESAPLRAGKLRALLAALLLRPGQSVSVDELIDSLWGETPPAQARVTLHTYVLRLRRALGEAAELLRTTSNGYLVDATPRTLDTARFQELLERAREHSGDPAAEAESLRQALELWRGSALADVPGETLHREEVPRLLEHRLRAWERRIDLDLRLGRHADVLPELTALTAEYPLRERFWGQLMLALYRAGRQAEALDAYRKVKAVLSDELGLDPGAELQRLHRDLLTGDISGTSPGPVSGRPRTGGRGEAHARGQQGPEDGREQGRAEPALWTVQCQLPPDLADFVGRESDREVAEDLLERGSRAGVPDILVISGPPGVGKTALAVRLAHRLRERFPDGQWYAPLDGAQGNPRDPADVLADLLLAAGVEAGAIPDGLQQRASALRARLADRRVLVLLDDAADTAQVRPLLPGRPGSAVLVTSRRRLGTLDGVKALPLAPFTPDESARLLERLVGAERVAEEPAATEELTRTLGGLPLALRITGARLAARPNWTLTRFAGRLHDEQRRLDELAFGDLAVRASLELSYTALGARARTAFRRLGLIGAHDVAAWTLGVLTDGTDGEELVEELLEAGLLIPTGVDDCGEPRYRLHDLLAVYARELTVLTPDQETSDALQRLLSTLVSLTDSCWARLPRPADGLPPEPHEAPTALPASEAARLTADPLAWLLAERAVIVDAVEWATRKGHYADAAALAHRAFMILDVYIGRRRVEQLWVRVRDAAREAGDDRVAWNAEERRCGQLIARGHVADAAAGLRECVTAFDRLGIRARLVHALDALASCLMEQDAPHEALAFARRALDLARNDGDMKLQAGALRELGAVMEHLDRYQESIDLFEQAVAITARIGAEGDMGNILGRMARAAMDHGDLPRAREAAGRALAIVSRTKDPYGAAWLTALSGRMAAAEDRHEEAVVLARDARQRFGDLSDGRGEHLAALTEATSLLALDRRDEALPLLATSDAVLTRLGATRLRDQARAALAAATRGADPRVAT
ncbi:AfsR/SARP family transcriptional regulator [Wenjunlia tyrosinilytica]|uniref:SARP family transcriptional regulator n=1 Tax=Wenjunlia tyrosinilytica TaxID=1544741 RepID=A0A918E064_9ACTN|nr:AfsR/SARP family transcriptional regulator [Wenjunlia tyrosinilytica]GGO92254.1 SARP family transcriptional regulator [Wenjunlia tyrosinilytica]